MHVRTSHRETHLAVDTDNHFTDSIHGERGIVHCPSIYVRILNLRINVYGLLKVFVFLFYIEKKTHKKKIKESHVCRQIQIQTTQMYIHWSRY